MEEVVLILYLFTFTVIVIVGIVFYLAKFSGIQRKKAVKTVEMRNIETIIKSYENSALILKEQNEFLLSDAKQAKHRLAAEIGVKLKANQEEITTSEVKITSKNLEEHYKIDVSNGLKLVESMNLPFLNNMDKSKIPELLNNPMVKGKVWNYIKENKDEMINLGVIIPIGQEDITIQKEKPKEKTVDKDGIPQLAFSEENSQFMG